MITVLKEQALQRWDTLPDDIREALVSEETSDFLWKTCEAEHIPSAKIYTVARLAGYVLFGFLHPEDLAAELRDALTIDIRIATAIANAINQRIFVPLRPQIDAVYKPITAGASSLATGFGPKILEEIRPVVPVGSRPMSGPAFARVGATGMGAPQPISTPLSRQAVSGPMLPPKPPMSGNLEKTESGKIPLPPKLAVSGDLRVASGNAGMRTPPSQPIGGLTSTAVPAPMPVFMQTDAALRPLAKVPDFKMKSGDQFASLASRPPVPPAKPAIIEFGIPRPPKSESRNQNPESSRNAGIASPPIPVPPGPTPQPFGNPVPLPPMPPRK